MDNDNRPAFDDRPAFDWSPEIQRDPYPLLRALREHDPIHRIEPLYGWFLTRYDDAVTVLRDGDLFSSRPTTATAEKKVKHRQHSPRHARSLDAFFERSPLFVDRPDHTRLRGLVTRSFTPRMVTGLRPRIQSLVDDLVDGLLESGQADFVRELADPLPAIVIAEMLGVPVGDREMFKRWSDGLVVLFDMFKSGDQVDHAAECIAQMGDYLTDLFEERRRSPGDDLLSALVSYEAKGDSLDSTELLAMCTLLLAAGHETTTNLLANGTYLLLENPGECKRLREDPRLVRPAIEEFLRYESPVMGMPRVATRSFDFLGHPFEQGDYVIVVVAAANRDPSQFPDPDRLDLGRQNNRHLAFGFGPHFCLGAPLARAEAEIAFSTLLRRIPHFEGDYREVKWKPTQVMRGVQSLPMRFTG